LEAHPKEIETCQRGDGSEPLTEWLATLDSKTEGIVLKRIHRVADGLFGDCEGVGKGVSELRIDYGPGYRVYFGQNGNTVYLIDGGTKRTQQRDIEAAQNFWSDYDD
jgi:putative addiction module killer protein